MAQGPRLRGLIRSHLNLQVLVGGRAHTKSDQPRHGMARHANMVPANGLRSSLLRGQQAAEAGPPRCSCSRGGGSGGGGGGDGRIAAAAALMGSEVDALRAGASPAGFAWRSPVVCGGGTGILPPPLTPGCAAVLPTCNLLAWPSLSHQRMRPCSVFRIMPLDAVGCCRVWLCVRAFVLLRATLLSASVTTAFLEVLESTVGGRVGLRPGVMVHAACRFAGWMETGTAKGCEGGSLSRGRGSQETSA